MKIKHDIHNHSLYSLCCYDPRANVENFLKKAHELGHEVFGISNHLWDETMPGASKWYKQQMINYGLEARHAVATLDNFGMKVLIGTESEYAALTDSLGMSAKTAERFDYVLIPHTHMHMRGFVMNDPPEILEARAELAAKIYEKLSADGLCVSMEQARSMAATFKYSDIEAKIKDKDSYNPIRYYADFMVSSFKSLMSNEEFRKIAKTVPTAVAHPFHPCGFSQEDRVKIIKAVDDSEYRECFELAKALNVAMEINTASFSLPENDYANEPHIHSFKIAREVGIKFSFGTDAHSVEGLSGIHKADDIARILELDENDLIELVKV